jgi:hypothetical protein
MKTNDADPFNYERETNARLNASRQARLDPKTQNAHKKTSIQKCRRRNSISTSSFSTE